ncbi:MAG: hypothetical protein JSU05_03790, partial [Bacteroidetes bacterium]|nr:hypothetical protein [Bacteroidota bacterium]
GINNRYAGFFRTERAGLDTLVYIGDEVLRNPDKNEVDSVLKDWSKTDIDSVGFVSVTKDSAYVFPLTNYQSSLLETRTAGDNSLVSEVVRQGDFKFLYRLRVDENTLRRRNVTAKPTEYMKKLAEEKRSSNAVMYQQPDAKKDTVKNNDFFISEFKDEKPDTTSKVGKVYDAEEIPTKESILEKAKVFEYRPPKFFGDYAVTGLNNSVLVNRYQPYGGGAGPIYLANGDPLSGIVRLGTADLLEDWKISGGFRLSPNFNNNEYVFNTQYLKKRIDYGVTYYRDVERVTIDAGNGFGLDGKTYSNLYQANFAYPFNKIKSLRLNVGFRSDKTVILATDGVGPLPITLQLETQKVNYGLMHLEYVHDDVTNPALNIWNGLRYKVYADWYTMLSKYSISANRPNTFNLGFDARHYLPIYRNFIWAVRAAGDFSWGTRKFIYYLGGVDGWLMFGGNINKNGNYKYFNEANKPAPDVDYAYQSLAVNMRGFIQNVSSGNNAVVLNSELRLPVFATLFNKPINNAFLRNFQVVQFIDLGSAWNGGYDKIARPTVNYTDNSSGNPITIQIKAGGVGPFAGGYGFGARSTLLGYFLRFDVAWQMNRFFGHQKQFYFAMGLDF